MGKIKHQSINSRTEFFYYAFRNILLVSLPVLAVSALILSHSFSHVSADSPNNGSGSSTDSLTFSISSSCTLSSVVDSGHNAELNNGTYVDGIGKTTITTLCNDGNGYSIYAVGYSNNEEGNNQLINTVNSNFNIDTGLATSGLTSNWAMSLNNVVNDISPTPPEIEDDYDGIYGLVPNEWTKVASLPSRSTDMVKGSSFTTNYAVYTSSFQNAGTYNGQVKYMLVHPSYKPAIRFMQDIAEWKNMLAMEESVQAIDKRDGKSYWVTKLKDGNIWMTQNLDFDLVVDEQDSTKMKTLTSEDTDLIDHSLTGAYSQANGYSYDENTGVISWTPASTAKTINFEGTVVAGWQDSNTVPYSANKTDDTNTGHASIGNYYNWTIAIASNNSESYNASSVATNSICPRGWRLPDSANYEFSELLYTYGITTNNANNTSYASGGFDKIIASPLYFVQSGEVTGQKLENNSYGSYWSSATIDGRPYYLLFNNSKIVTASYNDNILKDGKRAGFSVRCLAR